MSDPRFDKYLWTVRLFKTRSQAAAACKKGHVTINGKAAKAAQPARKGDTIAVKTTPIWRTFQILDHPANRVKGALVPEYLLENTPPEELKRLEEYRLVQRDQILFQHDRGRPTKRDRRKIDRFKSDD
ncbi:MAG: RNA-binding S4 domain-containing protein [Cryomorphaceae bacterium]|nr:MAG: RNA-binding S4 domain-containing protein [Cryomorphaceae bacterium]